MNADTQQILIDLQAAINKAPEEMRTKLERRLSLAESLINTANYMAKVCKEFPRNGKHNPFIKTYNRRPMNKPKRAQAMVKLSMGAAFGAVGIANIISQPILKQDGCRLINSCASPEVIKK